MKNENASDKINPLFYFIFPFSVLARGLWDVWSQTVVHVLSAFIVLFLSVKSNFELKINTPLRIFSIFVACLFLNIFLSKNTLNSFSEFLNYFNYFLVFLIVRQMTHDELYRLKKAIFYSGFLAAALFLMQKIFLPTGGLWASFPKQNILASVLTISLFIALKLMTQRKFGDTRLFSGSAVIAAALFFSLTASAAIGLAAGICYLAAKKFNKNRYALALFAVVTAMILFKKLSEPNAVDRYFWWMASFKMFLQNPLFGVGLGNFERYVSQYNLSGFHSMYAHNYYLQMLSETGPAGFSLFVVLMWSVLKNATDRYVFAAILALLISGLTDYPLHIPVVGVFLFALSGTGSAEVKKLNFGVSHKIIFVSAIILFASAGYLKFLVSRSLEMARQMSLEKKYSESNALLEEFPLGAIAKPQIYEITLKNYLGLSKKREALFAAENLVASEKSLAQNWYNLSSAAKINRNFSLQILALKKAVEIAPYNKKYRDELVNEK